MLYLVNSASRSTSDLTSKTEEINTTQIAVIGCRKANTSGKRMTLVSSIPLGRSAPIQAAPRTPLILSRPEPIQAAQQTPRIKEIPAGRATLGEVAEVEIAFRSTTTRASLCQREMTPQQTTAPAEERHVVTTTSQPTTVPAEEPITLHFQKSECILRLSIAALEHPSAETLTDSHSPDSGSHHFSPETITQGRPGQVRAPEQLSPLQKQGPSEDGRSGP